jgi:hypothetical protein
MANAPEFLTHLVRTALGRGQPVSPAVSLSQDDMALKDDAEALPIEAPSPADEDARKDPGVDFDSGIVSVLSEKVLLAWLRNRYQLLFPFALDLRRLDERQAELLVHTMIAAAQADGSFDGKERKRIEGTLNLVDPNEDEKAFLEKVMARPRPLYEILSEVHDVQTGALVYAASLMAVDQRKPVNRHFLRYLAARLQLSEELVDSLEQRYRSSS